MQKEERARLREKLIGSRQGSHGMSDTRTHRAWLSMFQRCYNPHNANYGGRGIKVCKRWFDFENFLKDMGEAPIGLSLDRDNVNGDYNKENCRWATSKLQGINKQIKKRNLPTGVRKTPTGKYVARIGNNSCHIGTFNTAEEAHSAYLKRKNEIILNEVEKIKNLKTKN